MTVLWKFDPVNFRWKAFAKGLTLQTFERVVAPRLGTHAMKIEVLLKSAIANEPVRENPDRLV